jgi:hypothetical protein
MRPDAPTAPIVPIVASPEHETQYPSQFAKLRRMALAGFSVLGLAGTLTVIGSLPAGAKSHANSPKPLGTTFAFPDSDSTVVDITLSQVVINAPAKTHYKGLHGKGPVIGLEFTLKNISAKPASLALFSSVLYYSNTVSAVTGSLGATKLGSSLKLSGSMAPGSHRQGWVTAQGSNKKIIKIQSTLNGANTGSWKS